MPISRPSGLLLALLAIQAFAGEPRIAELAVPSMDCSLCPITVRKALERVPGVIGAKADLAAKSAQVKYDPDKVSPEVLARAVSDAGFPATVKR